MFGRRKAEVGSSRACRLCRGKLLLGESWQEGELKLNVFVRLPERFEKGHAPSHAPSHALFYLSADEVAVMADALVRTDWTGSLIVADRSGTERGVERLEIERDSEGTYKVNANTGSILESEYLWLSDSELWAMREMLRVSYLRMTGWQL